MAITNFLYLDYDWFPFGACPRKCCCTFYIHSILTMTYILGISSFYHDSAAALIHNGEILNAVQEERFTRIKHDPSFPINSIKWILEENNIELSQIDYFVFYDKPFIKFDRLIETYIDQSPLGFKSFKLAIPLWLKEKLLIVIKFPQKK